LYAANGILPLLICAGRGMWWAVVLGAAAMGLPLLLAVRRSARAAATQREMPRGERPERGKRVGRGVAASG
jgi:predicted phage tail protein